MLRGAFWVTILWIQRTDSKNIAQRYSVFQVCGMGGYTPFWRGDPSIPSSINFNITTWPPLVLEYT